MNKKHELPKMEKNELFVAVFKEHQMATLIARRLHNYFNEKNMKRSFGYKKVSFMTSNSGGTTSLFIGCATPIGQVLETVVTSMTNRFQQELKPYFTKTK